ncbi:hypothetical protein A2U01_0065444 [Trifolium medium]|uniref:Uncharacterized protein n=1 Tax=Trifolium medium TaxID=97028 RepID=A0A392S8H3_9FABA|nr:hypothetical protein [Trifolium medium]
MLKVKVREDRSKRAKKSIPTKIHSSEFKSSLSANGFVNVASSWEVEIVEDRGTRPLRISFEDVSQAL